MTVKSHAPADKAGGGRDTGAVDCELQPQISTSLPASQALTFLHTVYDGAPGWLTVYLLPSKATHWVSTEDLERAARIALDASGRGQNAYVNVGLQRERLAEGRGKAATTCALVGLWADVDVQSPAHESKTLPPDLEAAQTLLVEFPLPPTVLVHSGHGLQAWWLLREAWAFDSDEEQAEAADLARRFQATLQAKAKAHGWTIDTTSDLARILRPPGTINRKPDCEPAPVRLLSIDEAARYTPSDFEPYLVFDSDDRNNGHEPRRVNVLQEMESARQALSRLAPERCENYDDWLHVGMALTELGAVGLELWDAWSQKSPKYEPGGCAQKWRTLEPGQGITLPSLYRWAAEDTPATGSAAAAAKPRINAGVRDLKTVSEQGWQAVCQDNDPPHLFSYGDGPTRVELDKQGLATLRQLTPDRLRHELARMAVWYRRELVGGEWKEFPAAPPKDVVADMLAYPSQSIPLPALDRIVRAPTFAADGTLQTTPGYHPAGRVLIHLDNGLSIPPMPQTPTGADVKAALGLIGELLADFPFVGDADRTHTVALLLLPFVRDLIDGPTPLHLIEAPGAGTGKGLLASVVLMPGIGADMGAMTYGRDEDETRKRIVSKLREGKPAVLLDNVALLVDSAALSSALTERVVSDRLLKTNEMLNLPVRCVWAMTANNPQLSTEIARRSIRIRLDAKTDRPWQRDPASFHHPALHEWARQRRGELIRAALVLAQSWLAAGRPPAEVRPLGSYEAWSRVVGGILAHADLPGFLENLDELYEHADSEGTVWRRFVEAWWEDHRANPVGVAVLYPLAEAMEDFDLGKGEERARKTALGMGLKRRRDMVIGGYRIESAGTEQRAAQWHLSRVRGEKK